VNKLELTKQLHDLREAVKNKKFHEAEELFKEIESVKVRIKALVKE
jgi:pentatricopeptide repeat protein